MNLQLPDLTKTGTRLVRVVVACRNCRREHQVRVDPDGRLPVEALVCGDERCRQVRDPANAAA